jgi:DNA-binding HxlR family transcriptional regulator
MEDKKVKFTNILLVRETEANKDRKSRARVLLDYDDLFILWHLEQGKENSCPIEVIKKNLNFSHNALMIHVNRLKDLGIITVERYKEDYKQKYIKLTKEAETLYSDLKKIKGVSDYTKKNFFRIEIKKTEK